MSNRSPSRFVNLPPTYAICPLPLVLFSFKFHDTYSSEDKSVNTYEYMIAYILTCMDLHVKCRKKEAFNVSHFQCLIRVQLCAVWVGLDATAGIYINTLLNIHFTQRLTHPNAHLVIFLLNFVLFFLLLPCKCNNRARSMCVNTI